MITLNLDKYLEKKLSTFAKENNIQTKELIETILYEYIEKIEEEKGQINISISHEEEEYNDADIDYVAKSMGFGDSLKNK